MELRRLFVSAAVLLLALLALLVCPVTASSNNETVAKDNDTLLMLIAEMLASDSYDKKIRPDADAGEATFVTVNIFINTISSVNEVDMDFEMNMYLRQEWRDHRLAHPAIDKTVTLNYDQYEDLWVPDLFFPFEKASTLHDITVPNRLLMLSSDGHILYSQRVSVTLACNMYLEKYPMDNQTCYLQMESYGYTASEMVILWKEVNAFNINRNLQLPEFRMTGLGSLDCEQSYPITGEFSCIKAVVTLKRHFNYYLIQTYIPSVLIVILSWVSFWIDKDAVPARITLGLLTVLTMTTQVSGINQRLPRVSYVKAIDVWMSTCLIFVFGALVEYSIVNVLARKDKSLHLRVSKTEDKRQSPSKMDIYTVSVESDQGDGSELRHRNSETGIAISEEDVEMDIAAAAAAAAATSSTHRSISSSPSSAASPSSSSPPASPKKRRRSYKRQCALFCKLHFAELMEESRADSADILSRGLFPLTFIVFNIFYWTLYLHVL